MQIFRIGTVDHPVWDGQGAALLGGRWNPAGAAVIYAAGSRALAMIERLAQRRKLTGDLLVTADVPDDMAWSDCLAAPPVGWKDRSGAAMRAGTDWLTSCQTALLWVPSVLVPEEPNWLVNPAHPGAVRIVAGRPCRLEWDERLLGRPAS